MTIRNLDYLFKPDAIALVADGGESEVLIARNLMKSGFKGPIMPVDPKRAALEGALAYRNIAELPVSPALAIITRPLAQAPALIAQLGERGARAAVLYSDARGIPEDERARLYQAILDAAKPYLLRVLGPGSQGFNVPITQLNASLDRQPLLPGQIAFVSESGTIGQTAVDIGDHYSFGFSHLIHLGDGLDIDLADILDYLAGDYRVRAILLYLESIGDARKFMSAARRAARVKPVIVLKPRRFPEGLDDAVFAAAFRRAGLLRVDDSDELFQMVEVLKAAKLVNNDRLAILSNSSSMSLLATDVLYDFGGRLAQFSEATQQGLTTLIDASARPNPLDIGDQADEKAYGKALDLLLADPGVDGVLVIKTPSTFTDTTAVADTLLQRPTASRCVIASFPGPKTGAEARRRLGRKVPTYETAGDAVQAFMRIVQYKRNQALLMETPPSLPEEFSADIAAAKAIIAQALDGGRRILNEHEALRLLGAYAIPVAETLTARSPYEAGQLAARLNQAVTLKIVSPDVANKSQIGGVARYLNTPEAVQQTATAMLMRLRSVAPAARFDGYVLQPMIPRDGSYELALGVRPGGGFGPVIYFGQGGTEAETINDFTYGLPPINMHLAREIMAQTRIYKRLRYSLLRRADLKALALTLVKISQMVIDLPELAELHINPLWVNAEGVVALDARVHLTPAAASVPAERLAIRPYPNELEETITLPDHRQLLLRPVLPEDEPALHALVSRASPEDLRRRFFQPIRELSHEMAAGLTQIDYHREIALVAVGPGLPGKAVVYGIVNLSADPNNDRAEYSILVDRALIGMRLGNLLMRRIIDYARSRGIGEIYGEVLKENTPMLQLNQSLGFSIQSDDDDPALKHVILKLHHVDSSAG